MGCLVKNCNNSIVCKGVCRNHYMQQYRSRPENKKKTKQLWDDWFLNNQQHYKDKKKELRETKEYKERVCEYRKELYHNNFNFKLTCVLRTGIHRGLNANHKSNPVMKILGCSVDHLRNYLESKFQDGMTWKNWTIHGWHIDHIVPISSFDLSNEEMMKKACHYTNLQPLWCDDNWSKSDRI